MKKLVRNIVKSTGIMGLMALLIAAAALAAGTPSASAASVNTSTGGANPGKLNVSVYAAQGGLNGLSNASTVVLDGKGEAIVKGTTNNKGSFASYVPEGVYTLKVSAPGYQGFSTAIKITAGQSTIIQVTLTAINPSTDPVSTLTPEPSLTSTPMPVATTTSDPASAQGKLTVSIENMSMSPVAIKGSVLIFDQTGTVVAKGETDPAGNFATMIAAGKYTVLVQADGFNPVKQLVEVVAGQPAQTKVTLTRVNQ